MAQIENHFVIRTYGFGELAQMYMPNIAKCSASISFRKWITLNPKLYKAIPKGTRTIKPKEVRLIIQEFDLPELYLRQFELE